MVSSFLQPLSRLTGYPIGGLKMVLKCINLFNRPIRPFGLDRPLLTVAKYRAEKGPLSNCGHLDVYAIFACLGGWPMTP